ncbi:MAG TPA: hypothetical protein VGF97_04410 [Rhizomicrobium sp.]|jgi:hypothetical protein
MVLAIIAAGALASAAAAADDPATDRTLHDYVLTMDKVNHFSAAMDAFDVASKSDPSLKAEGDAMSSEPDATLAQVEAKFDHHPRVFAFYAKQGLSKADAAVLPIALMDACTAVQYPQVAAKMASRIAPSQVAFCKANLATLKAMKFFGASEQ